MHFGAWHLEDVDIVIKAELHHRLDCRRSVFRQPVSHHRLSQQTVRNEYAVIRAIQDSSPPPELIAQTGHRDPSEAWAFGSAHLHTEFFEDGQMASQRIRLDDEHELLAGSRVWFTNGQPKCQADQLPGRLAEHVHWQCWYDNGKKKEEGGVRGDVRHGEWTEWSKTGAVRLHGTYFEGKKTGTDPKNVRKSLHNFRLTTQGDLGGKKWSPFFEWLERKIR